MTTRTITNRAVTAAAIPLILTGTLTAAGCSSSSSGTSSKSGQSQSGQAHHKKAKSGTPTKKTHTRAFPEHRTKGKGKSLTKKCARSHAWWKNVSGHPQVHLKGSGPLTYTITALGQTKTGTIKKGKHSTVVTLHAATHKKTSVRLSVSGHYKGSCIVPRIK